MKTKNEFEGQRENRRTDEPMNFECGMWNVEWVVILNPIYRDQDNRLGQDDSGPFHVIDFTAKNAKYRHRQGLLSSLRVLRGYPK